MSTPLYLAAATSFHKYVHWKLETYPDAWKGSDSAELLYVILIGRITAPSLGVHGPVETGLETMIRMSSDLRLLRKVLEFGGNPNFAFRNLEVAGSVGTQTGTPWVCFLYYVFSLRPVAMDSKGGKDEIALLYECARWSAIEMMLEFGGVPPFWSASLEDLEDKEDIEDEDTENEEGAEVESVLTIILTVGDSTYDFVVDLATGAPSPLMMNADRALVDSMATAIYRVVQSI